MPASTPKSADAQRAFPSHPRVDRYFATEAIETQRRRLVELLQRGDGPGLLIGAPGVGKSMLLEAIAAEIISPLRVVQLSCTQLCTRRALLQSILRGLDLPYTNRDEGQLRLSLIDGLEASEGPVALLVDEAQSLPLRLLEELRVLSNVAVGGSPLLRLILAGTSSLDEALAAPELESFSQRVAARCYLSPLGYDDTAHYVRAHIAAAGGDPDTLLMPEAYQAIHAASDGVPRLINQVGDRALVLAVERGEEAISAASIQAAWSDLNQLPTPWYTPQPVEAPLAEIAGEESSAVEFGPLDDLDGEPLEISSDASPPIAEQDSYLADPQKENEVFSDADSVEGVWNADAGLPIAAKKAAEETCDISEECVSLAFPGVVSADPTNVVAAEDPGESPEAEQTSDGPLADDPFEESFDEEEVLIDRYSDLAAVTPAGIEPVVNRQDIEFGKLFQGLDPAVESLVAEVAGSEPVEAVGFKVLQAVPPVTQDLPKIANDELEEDELEDTDSEEDLASSSESAEEEDLEPGPILVVESDPDEAEVGVKRREYSQLFASLRQG